MYANIKYMFKISDSDICKPDAIWDFESFRI